MIRTILHLIIFFTLILIAFNPQYRPITPNMISEFLQPSLKVGNSTSLLEKIREKSKMYEVAPENAKIDKVWKKMPGRNGLKVNIEKSYKKMKEAGKFDKSLLIFDEIEPEVTFEELPPAPVYRGHPEKKMVSLLINVAWGEENIPSILNTLKKHKVKANFFIEGKWASKNTNLVKMIKEEGHLIGNHAYNHPDMKRLTNEQNKEQIQKTNDILKAITGDIPKWFAPPSGSFNDQVVKIAAQLGMETVLWTVDTIDWKNPTTPVMVKRVIDNIHPGATILMHPTTVVEKGLDELIIKIKQKGYKIGTVEKLVSEKR